MTTTATGGDDNDNGDGATGYDNDGVGATGDEVGNDDGKGTMSDDNDGDGATGNVDNDGNDKDYGNGRRQRSRRRDGRHVDGNDTMATARRATKSTMMA